MLARPGEVWKTEQLSRAAKVSLGQISNVRNLLLTQEWAEERSPGFALTRPKPLLEQWASSYRFDRNPVAQCYAMQSVGEVEARLAELCDRDGVGYALTGFSGAARYASFTTYRTAAAYVAGDVDRIVEQIGGKRVSTGANLQLITPYDDGVFFERKVFDGQTAAAPIQCYLDLQHETARGAEAAEALLGSVIEPSWQ